MAGKLKHPQSLRHLRQMYYNNDTAQHSVTSDQVTMLPGKYRRYL